MVEVPGANKNSNETKWVPDPDVEELLGTGKVLTRRHIPTVAGWGGRAEKTLVRPASGFGYDLADGLHEDSRATLIGQIKKV